MSEVDTPMAIALLHEYAQRTALRRSNPYRAKACSRAADSLAALPAGMLFAGVGTTFIILGAGACRALLPDDGFKHCRPQGAGHGDNAPP
jgi:hypothetical protein